MTEAQYRALCASCDRLLKHVAGLEGGVAIPWLHVIREHPVLLEQYQAVLNPQQPVLIAGIRQHIWEGLKRLRLIWRALWASSEPWLGQLPTGRLDYVLVSHLLSADQLHAAEDFYYGPVIEALRRRGKSAVLVLIDYTGESRARLRQRLAASPVPRVVLASARPLRVELGNWWRQRRVAQTIRAIGSDSGIPPAMLRRAQAEAVSCDALAAIRTGQALAELVGRRSVGSVTVTWEGHAWERAVVAAVKRRNPVVQRIAYQHAALFRLQHAALRPLANANDPDKFLAVGPRAEARLRTHYSDANIPVEVVGSARSVPVESTQGGSACLVLPEGMEAECLHLFRFSLECAKACPGQIFIWRTHPILPFAQLANKNSSLRNLPDNIIVSSSNFAADIARSGWGLYRGSTAIITAGAHNVRPIYFRQGDEMLIDPLWELEPHRSSVSTVDDFLAALQAPHAGNHVQQYCQDYFQPWNHDVW